MAARREGPRPVRRPPVKQASASGGLGRALGALVRSAWPHWPWAAALILVASGGVLGLALVFPGGSVATPLNAWQGRMLGWAAPLLACWLTAVGVAVLWRHLQPEVHLPWRR